MSFSSLIRFRLAYGCDACFKNRSEIYKLSAGYNRFRRSMHKNGFALSKASSNLVAKALTLTDKKTGTEITGLVKSQQQ